ncbi:flippase-like domain-containing protein [bacterium]|nr:flippase-like domain-containing protein [bacterium]
MDSTSINKKTVKHGLRIFLILTLIGFGVIFYLTGSKETIKALKDFRWEFFLLCALLFGVDLVSGTARIFIFIRKMDGMNNKTAWWGAFKANLANIFLAAATPFQTGGGVAQIYMLKRSGVSVAGATSVSIMNFVATLTFLMAAGLMVLRWMSNQFADLPIQAILKLSSGVFYGVTLIFFVFLFKPVWIGNVLEKILSWLSHRWKKRADALHHASTKVHEFVETYQGYLKFFWKNEKPTLFHNIWLTLVLYFNKCLMAYVVLKGMGIEADFWQVISIQMLLIFLIYFCPTPGASFMAETSAAALMSLIIPNHLVSVFSILWRFFTTYFGVIIGGYILMRAIGVTDGDNAQKITLTA